MPFAGVNAPAAALYAHLPRGGPCPLDQWLLDLHKSDEPPKEEQVAILRCVINRVKYERDAERLDLAEHRARQLRQPLKRRRVVELEPMSALIHGLPGTGNSEVIRYIRRLFEDVLRWEHGKEFVFLAVQNTAAAEIGGFTIHSWALIPVNDSHRAQLRAASSGKQDVSKTFLRCQNLRFLFIDEISMVAPELFADLESTTVRAVRNRHTCKVRADGSHRAFGGVNFGAFGDWWQLPPVGAAVALFGNPCKATNNRARQGMDFFWGDNQNRILTLFELVENVRCKDVWHRHVLEGCRNGTETEEVYNFVHGFPLNM